MADSFWTTDKLSELKKQVGKMKCLSDKTDENFHKARVRKVAWQAIADCLQSNAESCQAEWEKMRRREKRCAKKRNCSGDGEAGGSGPPDQTDSHSTYTTNPSKSSLGPLNDESSAKALGATVSSGKTTEGTSKDASGASSHMTLRKRKRQTISSASTATSNMSLQKIKLEKTSNKNKNKVLSAEALEGPSNSKTGASSNMSLQKIKLEKASNNKKNKVLSTEANPEVIVVEKSSSDEDGCDEEDKSIPDNIKHYSLPINSKANTSINITGFENVATTITNSTLKQDQQFDMLFNHLMTNNPCGNHTSCGNHTASANQDPSNVPPEVMKYIEHLCKKMKDYLIQCWFECNNTDDQS